MVKGRSLTAAKTHPVPVTALPDGRDHSGLRVTRQDVHHDDARQVSCLLDVVVADVTVVTSIELEGSRCVGRRSEDVQNLSRFRQGMQERSTGRGNGRAGSLDRSSLPCIACLLIRALCRPRAVTDCLGPLASPGERLRSPVHIAIMEFPAVGADGTAAGTAGAHCCSTRLLGSSGSQPRCQCLNSGRRHHRHQERQDETGYDGFFLDVASGGSQEVDDPGGHEVRDDVHKDVTAEG